MRYSGAVSQGNASLAHQPLRRWVLGHRKPQQRAAVDGQEQEMRMLLKAIVGTTEINRCNLLHAGKSSRSAMADPAGIRLTRSRATRRQCLAVAENCRRGACRPHYGRESAAVSCHLTSRGRPINTPTAEHCPRDAGHGQCRSINKYRFLSSPELGNQFILISILTPRRARLIPWRSRWNF
jgi:hypothetical protein